MANRSSRVLLAILVLTVGVAAGCESTHHEHHDKGVATAGHTPPPAPPTPKDWKIYVGGRNPCHLNEDDDGTGSGPAAGVQRVQRDKHGIRWRSDQNMFVVLHVRNCDKKPFERATLLGYQDKDGADLYMIGDGKGPVADPGKASKDACPTTESGAILYDQCVQVPGSPAFQCCDGWIIIDK